MIENCCQGQLFGSTAQQGGNLENPDSQNLGACLSGREGTTTEFHSSTSRTPLVDY